MYSSIRGMGGITSICRRSRNTHKICVEPERERKIMSNDEVLRIEKALEENPQLLEFMKTAVTCNQEQLQIAVEEIRKGGVI